MRRAPLVSRHLAEPAPARPRRRPLFQPERGWFRRLERAVSLWLARHVFPWMPGLASIYSAQVRRMLVLSDATVHLPGLRPGLAGMKVLLLTDVHAGPFLHPAAVAEAVAKLSALAPDLVLHGGDLATSGLDEVDDVLAALAPLRGSLGTFAVLGNHDHYVEDVAALTRKIEAAGIQVLHNRAVVLERGGARLVLAGVDDLLMGKPDLDAALATAGPRHVGTPVVLLSHNPDVFFDAAARGIPLVLSGHTHGGQVRLPGLPVLVRQSRYRLDEGRYVSPSRRAEIVVSRGFGTTGVPLRVHCPPEAILLHLVAG
jgi:predicted MPP superfamily phosphohydrolase